MNLYRVIHRFHPHPHPTPIAVPVVNFTVDDATPDTGQPITLTYTGTGSPTSFLVDWGDGTTNGLLTHAYFAAATVSVTMTATNAGGDSLPVTKSNFILITAPVSVGIGAANIQFSASDTSPARITTPSNFISTATGNAVTITYCIANAASAWLDNRDGTTTALNVDGAQHTVAFNPTFSGDRPIVARDSLGIDVIQPCPFIVKRPDLAAPVKIGG